MSQIAQHVNFDVVLLAAGLSRRFGKANKLLVEIAGVPLVRLAGERVRSALPDARVIAVTGHDAAAVELALAGMADVFVHNPDFADGIARSVAAGIAATQREAGAMVVQGDMPALPAELLQGLADEFIAGDGTAIVYPATVDGRQRTPVIWPADLKGELLALTGDAGAKAIIGLHQDKCRPVIVEDETAFVDLDTPEAVTAWLQRNSG